jgi:hypothetical protein
VTGEPERTRDAAATRTRGPNSAFNDDRINIQPFHYCMSELPQPWPTQFVWAQGHPMKMETAQHQFTVEYINLRHNEQFAGRGNDVPCDNRIIR